MARRRSGSRRSSRRRRRRGSRGGRRKVRVEIDYVDEVVFPNLEKAERLGFHKIRGKLGGISLIAKTRVKGSTEAVFHYVFDYEKEKGAVIGHLGLKGLRGWDPGNPERVELPREYSFIRSRRKKV